MKPNLKSWLEDEGWEFQEDPLGNGNDTWRKRCIISKGRSCTLKIQQDTCAAHVSYDMELFFHYEGSDIKVTLDGGTPSNLKEWITKKRKLLEAIWCYAICKPECEIL